MSESTLGYIAVTVVVDGNVLVLHEGIVHSEVVVLQSVLVCLHFLDVIFGFLHHDVRLLEESREGVDFLSVLGNLSWILVLVDLEVKSKFLEDLHGLLLGKASQLLINFTRVAGKDLEFFTFN